MHQLNIVANVNGENELRSSAIDITSNVRPNWRKEHISLKRLGGGSTNTVVLLWCEDFDEKLLIRWLKNI